nr:hypothetical protein [Tanacetum cinerariifolium]
MAPATRSIATTSKNDKEDMGARLRSVENSLAQVTRALQELNQGMQGRPQNQNQFTRMTKVKFPKFLGDDVKGWIFRCELFFDIEISLNTRRFGTVFDDPISEMRKIKYQSNAKEYQDAFDTLLSRVDVSEEHVVSFYLGGLPAEIEMGVRMFKPTTLADAYQLTNYQESTLEAMRKKNKAAMNSQQGRVGGNGSGYGSNVKTPLLPLPSPTANWKTKPNTPATVTVRKQMTQKERVHEEVPQVSLNDLNGANYFQTMRITGKIRKHKVHILVDCGATHNFLDVNVAKQVGCKTNKTYPLEVAVGGGRKLISNDVCKNFEWQHQGETFYTYMMILPLGCCEMVLGIQWLATLRDIKCNFSKLRMEFMYKEKKMTLRGYAKENGVDPELSVVVDTFADVLKVPKDLPPKRSHDYRIPLLPNTQPVNIKPYRHPPMQKDAIEVMVKELLDSGVIKPSTIKDKFPIPIIEELIEELHGDTIFSKLDLSKSLEDHVQHLSAVLATMRQNQLFAKKSKCVFGTNQVKYLGYVISAKEVATYPTKINAMQEWPIPSNAKQLRGFLGLTGYYRRHFVNKIGHFSLKYLLDQKITTPTQMKWLPKLLGFDYEVVYKKGSANGAADALLRVQTSELFSMVTALVSTDLAKKIEASCQLTRKGKIVVGNDPELRKELLQYFHRGVVRGHSRTTPFETMYEIPPPIHVPYLGGLSKVEDVDRTLKDMEEFIQTLKFHLLKAQNKMKQQADKGRIERQFGIGDWVLLKLQLHRKVTVRMGQLIDIPLCDSDGKLAAQPLKVLDRKMVKKKNVVAVYGLIQWTNGNVDDATWEPLDKKSKDYPAFDLNS